MKPTLRLRLYPAALLGLLLGLSTPVFGLDLAARPLFAGTTVAPNVLVAVDDSGSMDFETLFPTDSGLLYWDSNTQSTWAGTGFVQNGYYGYAYLFPNGFNDYPEDESYSDRRIYPNYLPVPPIPQMAFARSSDYNRAYFDPGVTYTPWVPEEEFDNADPQNAPSDPVVDDYHFDLTSKRDADGIGEKFVVFPGMTIAKDTVYKDYCTQYKYNEQKDQYECSSEVGIWTPAQSSFVVEVAQTISIMYYPATFYLEPPSEWGGYSDAQFKESCESLLPSDYGHKDKLLIGYGPVGQRLCGYEIAEDTDAMQNFANWFTYYRKRHLATRGGIVAAFDRINDVRVGSCTINTREPIEEMLILDDPDDRSDFYEEIYNIDFSKALGTPNRKGLQFLGEQFQNNEDIITSPCQRNFAILFTDGYNTGTALSNVGNVDGDVSDEAPFEDSYSNTIADVAMHYYKNLVPDGEGSLQLPEGCPDPSLDCETDLHMVTFGVTLGQSGTIFNNDDYPDVNSTPYTDWPDSLKWPNPITNNYGKEQIDDLWHATINTRGQLLNARTPADLAAKFQTALEDILAQSGSASSVAVNSGSLTAESLAYQASFVADTWSGELKALEPTPTGYDKDNPVWEASEKLKEVTPANRVILTRVRSNCGKENDNTDAAAFDYESLKNGCETFDADEVAYLRGDRSQEQANGGEFRDRGDNILGDIIHSNPLYVGPPNRYRYPREWDDLRDDNDETGDEEQAGSYSDPTKDGSFAQSHATRTPMIYVGANDGMLHGFNANTGEELIAYVPNAVLDDLDELTDPNYTHQYYVDGSPIAGDVAFDGEWHTVLVGGLRGGGKSIYALDITNPGDFSEDEDNAEEIALWEFEHEELGYTYGQPAIVRLHNGEWAAIFGNGYNSCSGSAQLFIVDIETGDLIRRIDTAAESDGDGDDDDEDEDDDDDRCGHGDDDDDNCDDDDDCRDNDYSQANNGLGPVFPVDLDGDFITDYVYAGDLNGNLWKFDLTDEDEDDWEVGMDGKPLFVACADPANCDDTRQPITTQPQVGVHPYGPAYGVMVYFGTGKYLETSDRLADPDDPQNSFYGIWDLDVFTFNEANNGEGLFDTDLTSEIPHERLVEQVMDIRTGPDGRTYRVVSDNPVAYETAENPDGKRGWFLNLPDSQGEMLVTSPRLERSTISFSTTIPLEDNSCTAGGSGFFMLLDAETGGRTDFAAFDIDGNGSFTDDDKAFQEIEGEEDIGASGMKLEDGVPGAATHIIDQGEHKAYYIVPTSDGNIRRVLTPPPPYMNMRRSWREIRR